MTGRDRRARHRRATSRRDTKRRDASPPVALTIAGSDSSSGAGIQADLKTFSALGVYGLTAITCVVAEVPGKVSRIEPVSSNLVGEQIAVLSRDFPIGAAKLGLLFTAETVEAVARAIVDLSRDSAKRFPLVVDPVIIASSGERLLEPAAVEAYENEVFSLAALITPNLDEAALLLGTKIEDRQSMRKGATALGNKYRVPILLKGGHLHGDNATDLLFHREKLTEFSAPFVRGVATHGTGCTYSAAITAGLAAGLPLENAIRQAKKFVTRAIARRFRWRPRSGKNLNALRHL
jgi:hydroxymethylpyrimidine/phosphomethylpyrimidine kinase